MSNQTLLNVTEDTNLIFEQDTNLFIKSNANLNITISSNTSIVILVNKQIDINLILNRFATLEITLINFNNKLINFNADLFDASTLKANFIVINKNSEIIINQNVNHIGRETHSVIDNKAIAFSKSNIEFKTTGSIKKGIKNCNCNQLTRGLILQENATIKALPILLIDECDVKAYHGATIGNINENDLFYLMSRGLNKNEAFNLIINGLFKPFIEKVEEEKEKEKIVQKYNSYFK